MISSTSTTPNFENWRHLSSIKLWEIAALMHGFDPRAASEVAVRDPNNPASPFGVPPDTSWEERALISAVETGEIVSVNTNIMAPDAHTKIPTANLVPWLLEHGYEDLAAQLAPQVGTATVVQHGTITSEPDRRLKALRDIGGDANWRRSNGVQKWTFKKIKALTAQEKNNHQPRCDEKTIRKDLTDAAEAESLAKKSGSIR